MAIDFKTLEKLLDLTKKHKLSELEIEDSKFKVRIKTSRGLTAGSAFPGSYVMSGGSLPSSGAATGHSSLATKPIVAVENEDKYTKINSPFVGTFYQSPSPDSEAYVKVGQVVKKGDVLCIIEAMKLMNEIESDINGKVVSILAQNGQPVEYGQALFLIDPV